MRVQGLIFVNTAVLKALQTSRDSWRGDSAWLQVLEGVKRFILEPWLLHLTPAVRLVLLVTVQAPSRFAGLFSYPWVLVQFPCCQHGVRSYSVLVWGVSFYCQTRAGLWCWQVSLSLRMWLTDPEPSQWCGAQGICSWLSWLLTRMADRGEAYVQSINFLNSFLIQEFKEIKLESTNSETLKITLCIIMEYPLGTCLVYEIA